MSWRRNRYGQYQTALDLGPIGNAQPAALGCTRMDAAEIMLGAARGAELDGDMERARVLRRAARVADHRDGWTR